MCGGTSKRGNLEMEGREVVGRQEGGGGGI